MTPQGERRRHFKLHPYRRRIPVVKSLGCQLESYVIRAMTRGSMMARKKKVKRFRAVTAVKELARERVGSPPSEKIVVEKKKKPEKYKVSLEKLISEE